MQDVVEHSHVIRRNVLNIFNSNEIIENIIKELIGLNKDLFIAKYDEEVKKLEKTSFKQKNNDVEKVFFEMTKKHAKSSKHIETLMEILEKDFFVEGEIYTSFFHSRFINFLSYHFNIRRVYKYSWNKSVKNIEEKLLNEIAMKFSDKSFSSYENPSITQSAYKDSPFLCIEPSTTGIDIIEKIGVVYPNVHDKIKSVYVKYSFDFRNGFFEISYNDTSLKEICKLESSDKSILIKSGDDVPIQTKFRNEKKLINNLIFRMNSLLGDVITIKSINDGIAKIAVKEESISEQEKEIAPLIKKITEEEAFYTGPYEAALYQYFKEDKEQLLESVTGERQVKDSSEIEKILKGQFDEIDEENIDTSIKFLMNMQVYSAIKQNPSIVNKLDDYIFLFTVRDLAVSKSTTRNSERLPIYDTEFYWHLQEVIDSVKLLSELGIRLTCVNEENEKISQEVKVSVSTDHMYFMYFQNEKTGITSSKEGKIFKMAEGRDLIHEYFKNKFNDIVSAKTRH